MSWLYYSIIGNTYNCQGIIVFFLSYMKPDKKCTKQYSSNIHINDIKTYITR